MRHWLIKARGNRTQKYVAEKSNISQNFYSYIERGERRPSPEVAKRIASILDFDWKLFFDTGSKEDECEEKAV